MGGEKAEIISKLRKFKADIRKKYGVEKIIFFGSRASGGYKKHSDIDLILVSSKFRGKSFMKRPLGLYFYWNIEHPVDFICYTPEEFKKLSNKITIVKQAVEDGIEI